MTWDLRAGMKVICIDPTWGATGDFQRTYCPNLPTLGEVYTVRDIHVYRAYDEAFIRLVEVVNPAVESPNEPVFMASKFRPLVTRSTDISIFTKLLTPLPCKETA